VVSIGRVTALDTSTVTGVGSGFASAWAELAAVSLPRPHPASDPPSVARRTPHTHQLKIDRLPLKKTFLRRSAWPLALVLLILIVILIAINGSSITIKITITITMRSGIISIRHVSPVIKYTGAPAALHDDSMTKRFPPGR
jgi:hypothetical protein